MKDLRKKYSKEVIASLKDKPESIDLYTKMDLIKTNTMFEYDNLPEEIERREIEEILQVKGYGIFTKVGDKYYVLTGNDAPPLNGYYEATKMIVTNPWLKLNKTFTYDEDCILMRNDPYRMGLLPIIDRYNKLLVEADITLLNNLINMRAMNIVKANTDRTKAAFDEFFAQLELGNLKAVVDDSITFNDGQTESIPNTGSAPLTSLIELVQYLRGIKYNEIGLDSNFNMKRERLNSAEVEQNESMLLPLIDAMLHERENAIEKINKMYGLDIKVRLCSAWKDEDIDQEAEPEEEPAETTEEVKEDED